MSFLISIKNALIEAALKFAAFIKPVIVAGLSEVKDAALAAVLSEAPKVITGQEKFNSAVQNVVDTLKYQGKSVAIGIAQQEVQYAYDTYLKGK
jgi:hypothetical protein